MELMLEIISRQKFSAGFPTSCVFGKVGGYIGRSEECEWRIPDKEKRISRKHALISCDGTAFYIEDVSSNGIFSSLGKEPIGRGQRYKVGHGESFSIGDYSIQARLLHQPDAYLQTEVDGGSELIPADALLDLDPLVAMEQQEVHEAKRRLGLYNELLGDAEKKPVQVSDHNEPRLDSMLSVNAIPENWVDIGAVPPVGYASAVSPAAPINGMPNGTGGTNGHARYGGHAGHGVSEPLSSQFGGPLGGPALVNDAMSHNGQSFSSGLDMPQFVDPAMHEGVERQPIRPVMHPASQAVPGQHHTNAQSTYVMRAPVPPLLPPPPQVEYTQVPETDAFFKILGFPATPESPEERERVLRQAAELLLASVDGMIQSLQNRAESKNDLRLTMTTMRLANNNPLKFSPTAKAALELLLSAQEGLLPADKAMYAGFDDLHSHHMGLLAGARAAVRASLGKVAPPAVEARLDANGPVHFKRVSRLWSTYLRMHQALMDDHNGFAALFLQDFARAYEVQVRTLHPLADRSAKGEKL